MKDQCLTRQAQEKIRTTSQVDWAYCKTMVERISGEGMKVVRRNVFLGLI